MDAQTAEQDMTPAFTHRQVQRVVMGILLCILLAAMDQTVVVPAVPAIATDLKAFGHLAWIVTAYLLTSTAATPIYGKLSDSVGRRAILLPSIALFVVASALCAMSQTLLQLIMARALQGLGGAGLLSMAQAAIADVIAPRERGRYQAYMATTWASASVFGPILGGYVTQDFSWRWIFWINLPIGLLAAVLANRALKAVPVQRQKVRVDLLGSALLSTSITAFLLLLTWGGANYPWISPQIIGLGLLGVACLVMLLFQERRFAEPLLPPRLFANRVFVCGVGIAFFASLGMFACIFMLPLFYQLVHGADPERSGQLVMPFLLISTAASWTAGVQMRRSGRARGVLITGMVIAVIGLGLLALSDATTSLVWVVGFSCLAGIGIGVVMPGTMVSVQNAAERRDVGVATATMLFLRALGGAFGSTLSGAVVTAAFAESLVRAGVHGQINLGAMQSGSGAFGGLPSATRGLALDGLIHGFSLAFTISAALLVVAVAIAWVMEDIPLRATVEPVGPGH